MTTVRTSYIAGALALALTAGCQDGFVTGGDDDTVWITIGTDAVDTVRKSIPSGKAGKRGAFKTVKSSKDVAVVEMPSGDVPFLTEAMHDQFNRCGGFFFHDSFEDAAASLDGGATSKAAKAGVAKAFAGYSIDNPEVVNTLMAAVAEPEIRTTITGLSSFPTRYFTSQGGLQAPVFIRDLWAGYAQGRPDVTVELYDHQAFEQQSVILTIPGTTLPDEVVVLGGHLDSTAGFGGSGAAPGADDDASGIATMSEVIRVALAADFRPMRTVVFMAYAAEEVGLRGSREIAADFRASGVEVVGMMQLDMTNYNGSVEDIILISDYTNAAQNQFVGDLIDTYLGFAWTYDQCGYACSDHASWTNEGYAASTPFESRVSQFNPNIHTANDTLEGSGGDASHAVKFAKLASAYMAELAKGSLGGGGEPPPPPPGPQVQEFEGALAQGEEAQFGPFSVAPGTQFSAEITGNGGSGDADLYVRFGEEPTQSSFVCRPFRNGSAERCDLDVPSNQAEAYVMVHGFTSATFSLTVTHRPGEPDPDPEPEPGQRVVEQLSGQVASGAEDHFGPFPVVPGSDVTAVLSPVVGDGGDADIYLRFAQAPTRSAYDCRPFDFGSNETCDLTAPPAADQVFVMVRGYTSAAYEVELTYTTP